MLENIEILYHSSIRFSQNKIIYFDPFKINIDYKDADYIFITHEHYDHYSEKDIDKIIKEGTKIIAPIGMKEKLLNYGFKEEDIVLVEPNKKYSIDEIEIEVIPAYNINKQFHPKESKWVGYVIKLDNIKYYIAGDTDITEENQKVKCDIAFVPVGGTYTMNFTEAAKLINLIKPQIAVPTHYGEVVGTKQDATDFIKLLDYTIKGKILLNY